MMSKEAHDDRFLTPTKPETVYIASLTPDQE